MKIDLSIKKIISVIYTLINNQSGQDLIEYALVVALIAFAATASMGTLASDINNAFASVGNLLAGYTG